MIFFTGGLFFFADVYFDYLLASLNYLQIPLGAQICPLRYYRCCFDDPFQFPRHYFALFDSVAEMIPITHNE